MVNDLRQFSRSYLWVQLIIRKKTKETNTALQPCMQFSIYNRPTLACSTVYLPSSELCIPFNCRKFFLDFLTAIKRIFQPFRAFLFTWMTDFSATLSHKWNLYPSIYLKQNKITLSFRAEPPSIQPLKGVPTPLPEGAVFGQWQSFFSFWKTRLNSTKSLCVTSDDIL